MRVDVPQRRSAFEYNDNCIRRPAYDKFFDRSGTLKTMHRNILMNAPQMNWAYNTNRFSVYSTCSIIAVNYNLSGLTACELK